MRVLTDFHHGGLYGSMHLLARRMGWELFRPIGLDWLTQGWWNVALPYGNPDSTVNQYLAINDKPYVPYVNLNGDVKKVNDVYEIWDPENLIVHKAITFDTFRDMEFDLIIGTHPLHDMWDGLLQYHPKAKFIMQLGNENQSTQAKNILSSVWGYVPTSGQQVCYYHQEYPIDGLEWTEPCQEKLITNYVHLQPHPEVFEQFMRLLPDFTFRTYGSGNRDGIPITKFDMFDGMKKSTFGWHIKPTDGYGHLIHQWYACGRPVITKGDYYLGKTGGMLLSDGETCIDLDKHSVDESIRLIRYWSEPENHMKMCRAAYDRFHAVVDYDKEAESIKTFLSNIL